MKKWILPLLACLFCQNASAQISTTLAGRFQHLLDSLCIHYGIKGASAAVLIPGQGTWKGVYGMSSVSQPISPGMVLGIGSNTKTYIAATMLRLQEQQLIDLDDTIGQWFPNQPNINGQITLRQLLNHTSGLYNYTDNLAFNTAVNNDQDSVWQPAQILPYIGTPALSPGTGWDYSNTNYLLAGLIISQVLNQPLGQVLQQQIFQPQQLLHTYLIPEQTLNDTLTNFWTIYYAQPYLEDIISLYGYSPKSRFSIAWAAGGIVATAEDNVQFWHKLHTGQIINAGSLAEMSQTIYLSTNRSYGLGVFRTKNYNGRIVYGHGGTNLGFINENIVDSVSGVCISVLTNQDSVTNSILFNQVVSALHKATIQATAVLSPGSVANHSVRLYPNPAAESVIVSAQDNGHGLRAEVYDLAGKCIRRVQSLNGRMEINLDRLPYGSYIVWVYDGAGNRLGSERLQVSGR
jgi:D-alanyl-D-alanine carboxypeptidase